MKTTYTLTEKDLNELGLEKVEGATKYFAIQDGWFGWFEGIYAITFKENIRYDITVLDRSELGEVEEYYIIKNCKSIG